jgi:hypothetical protein
MVEGGRRSGGEYGLAVGRGRGWLVAKVALHVTGGRVRITYKW